MLKYYQNDSHYLLYTFFFFNFVEFDFSFNPEFVFLKFLISFLFYFNFAILCINYIYLFDKDISIFFGHCFLVNLIN